MLAAVLSCALEICVRRTVPRPVCLWLVGGALCNAWLLLLCWRCDWIQCRQRACSIHQSLYQGMRFTVEIPIFAAQGMSCCCLSVQNLFDDRPHRFQRVYGYILGTPCMPRAESSIRAVSLCAFLLRNPMFHASRLSRTRPPICSVVFQRVEVHSVVDAVNAIGVELKLLFQWPFQSPVPTKQTSTRRFVRPR